MKNKADEKWHEAFRSLPDRTPSGKLFSSIRKEYTEFQGWKSSLDVLPEIQPSLEYEEINSTHNAKRRTRRIAITYLTIAASFALLIISGLLLTKQDSTEQILISREVPVHVLDFDLMASDPHLLCLNLGLDCDFIEEDKFIDNWKELSSALNTLLNSTGNYPQDQFLLSEIIRIENKRIELFNQFLSETNI